MAGYEASKPSEEPTTESSLHPGGADFPIQTTTNSVPHAAAETQQAEPEKAEDETHYGRDAAILGGTAAAGAGAYELTKDDKSTDDKATDDKATDDAAEKKSRMDRIKDMFSSKSSKSEESKPEAKEERQAEPSTAAKEDDHGYGRDAAIAGGVGAAGAGSYAAYEATKGDEPSTSEPATSAPDAPEKTVEPAELDKALTAQTEDKSEPSYGRDAAIVGGKYAKHSRGL